MSETQIIALLMKLNQLCSCNFKSHKNDKQRVHFHYDFLSKWHTSVMFCKSGNIYKIIRLLLNT